MTSAFDLPPEQEQRLQERAAQQGYKDIGEYAQHLYDTMLGQPRPFHETATPEEWVAVFQLWANSHDPNGPVLLDDSREILYED